MSRTMLFIYNPKAGKARIRTKLADILDIFVQEGYEVTVRPTRKRADALEAVRDRKPVYDLVVCSGGDGTLDEVVTGMFLSSFDTPIGYIPAGSTNDFGGSLGLPKNMLEAAKIACGGQLFPCDVGSFNRDVFVYIAAFGLFTDVSYETNQEIKNVLGHMAYLLEGMRRLQKVRSYPMRVTWLEESGETRVIEDDFVFGMVTNSLSVGGFRRITGPSVRLDDGVFEVTLIRNPTNPIELNTTIAALLDRNIDSDTMYFFRTSRITLESDEEVAWTLDGESGGSHALVQIENLHRQVRIMAPEDRL